MDGECIFALLEVGPRTTRTPYGELLERPIDMEEIQHALRKGGHSKAPGSDGIRVEFYKANWTTIKDDLCTTLNQMFPAKTTTTQQKRGNRMLAQAWRIAETFGFSVYHTLERGLQTSHSNNRAMSTPSDGRTPSDDSILLRAWEYHPRCRSDRQRGDCAGENYTNPPVHAVTGFPRGVRQDIPPVPILHNEELRAKRLVHWSTKQHYDKTVSLV